MPMPAKSNENKRLTGSKPGKDLASGKPTKPQGLSAGAAAEWDRLEAELTEAGLLITKAHRGAMTMASTIAADIKSDWATLQADGQYELNTKTNTNQAHPALKRMDALRRDYAKFMALLGLRAAVSGGTGKEGETLDDVLNG
jgi:phage terminase small subunit